MKKEELTLDASRFVEALLNALFIPLLDSPVKVTEQRDGEKMFLSLEVWFKVPKQN